MIRGGVNGLMAEILEDHIAHDDSGSGSEDGVARGVGRRFDRTGAGLSRVTEHGVLRILGGSASAFPLRPGSIDRDHGSRTKKDGPEPPKPFLEPSRLEGQLDDLRLPGRCCKMMAGE